MKLKKNTDVYELKLDSMECIMLIPARSASGKKLTEALEDVLGSPALDDYKAKEAVEELTITRFRLPKDIKLKDY